ncbi:MAG: riboflavin synthase [Chloroflexi bacterium]|nr:riboflavin synthase [Chloroflexota bacterium]
MFTGIVEELGRIRGVDPRADGARLTIAARRVIEDATVGASIAVNGVCLTLVTHGEDWWTADAVAETLQITTLGLLKAGDRVNLERPVRLMDRLGGHLVQGHVDGVANVVDREPQGDGSTYFWLELPERLRRYVVEKGSITVDGVSLTVARVRQDGRIAIALIPHTQEVTTLGQRSKGDRVNVEVDVLAKYVERLLAGYAPPRP